MREESAFGEKSPGRFFVAGIPGFIHDGIIGMADGIEALNGCNLKTEFFKNLI